MDDATSGGVVEKSVFVVDDETAVKRTSYYKSVCRESYFEKDEMENVPL